MGLRNRSYCQAQGGRPNKRLRIEAKLLPVHPRPQAVKDVLKKRGDHQLRIPRYQRRYEWSIDQLHGLWRDLGVLYADSTAKSHFLGIVLKSSVASEPGISASEVIDGQQRLTTLLILFAALRDHMADQQGKAVTFDGDPQFYLWDMNDEVPRKDLVLRPQALDADDFNAAIHGEWRNRYKARSDWGRCLQAYEYFRYCLWRGEVTFRCSKSLEIPKARGTKPDTPESAWEAGGEQGNPSELKVELIQQCVRSRILLLVIEVSEQDEDPVLIFDSINGKRLEFAQWDHAKTLVFRRLGEADDLYEAWEKAEGDFHDAAERANSASTKHQALQESFLYNYLIATSLMSEERPNRQISAFQLRKRIQIDGRDRDQAEMRKFLGDQLLPAARAFAYLTCPSGTFKSKNGERSPEAIARQISQINALSAGPPQPLILRGLTWWLSGSITAKELGSLFGKLETLLARMHLAGRKFSPLRSQLMQLIAGCNGDGSKSPAEICTELSSEIQRRSPKDDEILEFNKKPQPLCGTGTSNRVSQAAILRGIETHLAGSTAHPLPFGKGPGKVEIEHIFPESCAKAINKYWLSDFRRWKKRPNPELFALRVNCIGNLALISGEANKRGAARGFGRKQEVLEDGATPPVKHVASVLKAKHWLPKDIDDRTTLMLGIALKHWR